ncbi:MAG: tRNA preQ1(34) S-adenosylmethionine ribosyltransferase-isomerase QueA [Candidatus Marinimicrobia bacterium]|nr:tRNA preQ1(34) S-adenosylmethionine ribosyltransferase-isomerase QueA [Candidatus Neomarinimicrobiota bacterium]|tara:strand:- start:6453 stop:7511 length:1059 start_codon:yes stop_codon:yes gene_type:complete
MYFGSVEKPPRLVEFKMEIPKARIAQKPYLKRDQCKLMVLDRSDESIHHLNFSDITDFFKKGDVLVKNHTKVFAARLFAKKDKSDANVEVFLLRELQPTLWEAMVRPARKVRIGNKLLFNDNIVCDVIDNTISGGRVLRFDFEGESLFPFIEKNGACPLPNYISRKPVDSDKKNYQTVYAEEQGSVAAPTAGMHFTPQLLDKLTKKGVINAPIVLHIGLGTFKPILVEDLTRHNMDSEYYTVPPETATTINKAKEKRRKITAVGTSTVRTLETVIVSGFQITSKKGWTDKFIYPPYDFKMVDQLITNFHQPQSTLMMLVAAFANKDFILRAYKEAIKKKYNFYSYGDAMLII